MNEHAQAPAQVSSADVANPAGLHNPGNTALSSFATRDETVQALRSDDARAQANDLSTDDDEDDDTINDLDGETATGLNPDPDVEKSAGAAELMTPDTAPGPEDNEPMDEDLDEETEAGL